MTDSSDIAARAREALNGITPGPWAWCQYGTQFEVFTESASTAPDDVADVADNLRHLADAEFIAAAPGLVRDLLAALETAETERDTVVDEIGEILQEDPPLIPDLLRRWVDGRVGGVS